MNHVPLQLFLAAGARHHLCHGRRIWEFLDDMWGEQPPCEEVRLRLEAEAEE
jgi:hypothetical protein